MTSTNTNSETGLSGASGSALSLVRVGDTYDGHPRYEVRTGGWTSGYIEGHNPTFERGPKRARYVTKRWRSKRRYWRVTDGGGKTIAWTVETIKRALRYFEPNTEVSNPAPKKPL